jgi:hypothetical protein
MVDGRISDRVKEYVEVSREDLVKLNGAIYYFEKVGNNYFKHEYARLSQKQQ